MKKVISKLSCLLKKLMGLWEKFNIYNLAIVYWYLFLKVALINFNSSFN